jgi:hypothetical protein
MSVKQLIIGTFNQTFKKYFYDELVIGKLAHSEFKSGVNKGDEVDVLMPGSVTLFNFDGEGDLPDAEVVTNSATKIRIDRGKAFHFEIKEIEEKAIENAPSMKQKVDLIKEYSSDAVKQFSATVDKAYGELFTRAGYKIDAGSVSGGSANAGKGIDLDADYAREILALMRTQFQKGDGYGHNNWVDGKMICIVPPEFEFYLGKLQMYGNVESGHRKIEKGFIGTLEGWDILVSNNVASYVDTNNSNKKTFAPLFGIRGKTLAGGVSSNLNTKSYEPEKNFNTRYKGYGLYGVGAPRADFLGTALIVAPTALSTRS